MTDTELLDEFERVLRESGPHNFFLVNNSGGKLIGVNADIVSNAAPVTDAHKSLRGALAQLVTAMDREHRGSIH